jgi:hypothetical protein
VKRESMSFSNKAFSELNDRRPTLGSPMKSGYPIDSGFA